MPKDIYSDIWGEVLFLEDGGWKVYLYHEGSNRYSPALILPNKLAVEKLIKYLQNGLKDME